MTMEANHYEKQISLSEYIEKKIDLLKDEFGLELSAYEEIHMKSLTSTSTVDLYARQLITEKL